MLKVSGRRMSLTPIVRSIISLSCSMGCTYALAQTAAPPSNAASASTGLQTITVSANKRIEKLEKVPSSISVLTEESIERNAIVDFNDIVNFTPSLTATNTPTFTSNNAINMRGIGTFSFTIGMSPDVAVIVDDIPVGLQMKAFQDLADVSRIEVLKGPQSTLFGRAAIAGAVVITSKPISGPLAGAAAFEFSNDRERRIKASYGGMLSPEFGLRVALSDNDFRGNVENLGNGKWTNGSKSQTAVIKAQWAPTSNFDLTLTPRYNRTLSLCCGTPLNFLDSKAAYYGGIPATTATQAPVSQVLAGITPGPRNMKIRTDAETKTLFQSSGTTLKANYSFDNGLTLTSITGVEKMKAKDQNDGDGTDVKVNAILNAFNNLPPPPAGSPAGQTFRGTFDTDTLTQEIRIVSPETGSLRYVAGLWYAKNDTFRFFTRGYTGLSAVAPREYRTSIVNENKALFGQANWDFTTDTTATIGVRLNREASSFTYKAGLPEPYPTGTFAPTIDVTGADGRFKTPEAVDTAVTSKLALQHQFDKQTMGYVSRSTGYKGYAYDLLSSTDKTRISQQPVDPETATSYEIGAKGNFLNNTLTANLTLFRTDIKGFQSTSNVPVQDPVTNTELFFPYLNSVGQVRSQGIELDVAALVSKRLLLNVAFAYIDAKITKYPFGDCYAVQGSANGGLNDNCIIKNPGRGNANTSDKAGNPLPQSPKVKFNIGGQYDIPLDGAFDLFITGSARYQAKTYLDLMNPTITIPGYTIANLGFGIKDKAQKYGLTFNIYNLFDKQYSYDSRSSTPFVAADTTTRVTSTQWFPARDAFRYASVRLDVKF